MKGMQSVKGLLATLALLLAPLWCGAQGTWTPNKPIRLIVTYAPGGSADVLARILQIPMGEALGVPIVVDNRAGGAGNTGTEAVARAAPDGYTIGIGAVSTHAINPALFGAKLPFKVPQDFTAISHLVNQPNVLLVHPSVPATNMKEFVEWARKNPALASFGTAGVGSSNHLTGELLNTRYGIQLVHVAYKSGGLALSDLTAGHIKIVIDNISTAANLVESGKARAIGVSTIRRSARLPNVQTFAEQGAPGFDLSSWQGLFAPAGLPEPVLRRLNEAAVQALKVPAVHARLEELGAEVVGSSPQDFTAFVAAELPKWGTLVRGSKMTIE